MSSPLLLLHLPKHLKRLAFPLPLRRLSSPLPIKGLPHSPPLSHSHSHSHSHASLAMDSLPSPLSYPSARRDPSVLDLYHGVPVPDPYRWLEDPDAQETREFVEAQVRVAGAVLAACEHRGRLRDRITEAYDYPRYGAPFHRGGRYFNFYNTGLQPQSVMYVQGSLDGKEEVLLDPNALSEDGTVALSKYAVSEDGRYLAYSLSSSGSDWVKIRVMRVGDKAEEPDTLSWVKFSSISWTHDSKGFFYSRYPAPREDLNLDAGTETNINLNNELYYHFLGTDQSADILCWKDPNNPKYSFGADITDDGKYVLLLISEDCDPVNKLYYFDLSSLPHGLEGLKNNKGMLPFIKLVDNFEARYEYVSNDGIEFTFLTNKNAPRYKLIRVDLEKPDVWTTVLDEAEKDVLESATAVGKNKILVSYLRDVKCVLHLIDLKTGKFLHELPIGIGSVSEVSGRHGDSEVFISFTSFLTPGIIYKCSVDSGVPGIEIYREIVVPGIDRAGFGVKQVFYHSKDGMKIPMFIISKKNINLDGTHPTLLYGYGGFNISLVPSFSVSRLVLTRNLGVISCIANIRGGGEYGEEWHKAGSLSKKQNCFDDFIAAAEFLVSSGYTNRRKLCIEGGSNGGLLVAACINQRPDLFGCALAHVGVMDMLRFHKFTIGHAWTSDYGSSEEEEEFKWLIKYSPLHNVRRPWEHKQSNVSCQYPATMLLTADHDDRVVPLHSLKLLATMQYVLCMAVENSKQTNPIIGRIDCKAGHGAGRPTKKMIDEAADRYGFMAKMLDLCWME